MELHDFEYDGITLSDMGYMVCEFDSSGLQTISNGSQITFNTVSTLNGKKYELTNTEYSECIEATFQICKDPCQYEDFEINTKELRDLMAWLNRKNFYKFKLLDDEYIDLFFESSFNVSILKFGDKICGLELKMTTNRPFALHEPISFVFENKKANGEFTINDSSDEEGFIYPHVEVDILENGTLTIHNSLENRTTEIKNCVIGEKIILDYPIIYSSIPSHKIQNDFNWNWFRIFNTFKNRRNDITISIPCTVKIKYSPIVKVSI